MDEVETFLLPFRTPEQLENAVEKIKEAWREQAIVHKEKLREKDIKFGEIGDYGVSIDIDLIPIEYVPQDVLNWFRDIPIIDLCHKELNIKLLKPDCKEVLQRL